MALPVILDCDPGHDDAIALILALASPELKVLAVTTSAGNQTPDKTLNNALRILTLLGRDDIPVAAGAPKPLARELIIADNVHGESGLDGPRLPDPGFAPVAMTALELMAKCLRESAEPVTLVPTGPLTNIALLLAAHLGPAEAVRHALAPGRLAYVHVIRGQVSLNGVALAAGDGAKIADESELAFQGGAEPGEFLLFDLPPAA